MLLLALLACRPTAPLGAPGATATATGQAMGGEVRVVVVCESIPAHDACQADALAARDEVVRLHGVLTDWEAPGEIAALDAAAGDHPVPIGPETEAVLRDALRIAEATDGDFDPTVGALWGLWDFDRQVIPSADALAGRLRLVDYHKLQISPGSAFLPEKGMAVTLGGIAQGFAAERALQQIPSRDAAVDVSGDIAVRGSFPLAIQHPRRPRGETFADLELVDAVLTTSGDYEHGFDLDGVRYHHILDPRTGQPGRGAISATVVSREGAVADALAKAFILRGPDAALADRLGAWALVVTPDGEVHEIGQRSGMVRHVSAPARIETARR